MNVRELIDDLEQYPDDYIAVVSTDTNGHRIVVAIDPLRYHKDRQASTIEAVVSDRRKLEEVCRSETSIRA